MPQVALHAQLVALVDQQALVFKTGAAVQHQRLFGGENMVVLFSVPDGGTVVDLLTAANIAQLEEIEAQLSADPAIQGVVSPVSLLRWTQDLITSGTASEILARTIEREPDPAAQELRRTDALITTLRLGAAGEQTFANPEWVRFLVFGNEGFSLDADDALTVRTALRAFVPDARHVILAAVLVGNAPLDDLADGAAAVEASLEGRDFGDAEVVITGTPTFLTDINDYLQGGMLTLGAIAVGVMVVILLVAFKVRWRLLPLAGMLLGAGAIAAGSRSNQVGMSGSAPMGVILGPMEIAKRSLLAYQ
ncbi:MAG: MMPL family transporter, partial [Gemmatimonas sp.]